MILVRGNAEYRREDSWSPINNGDNIHDNVYIISRPQPFFFTIVLASLVDLPRVSVVLGRVAPLLLIMPPKRQPAGVVRTAAEWKKIIDDQQNGIGMAIRINGDRKEVWEGKAYKTPSKGLTKKDLKLDPYGKVSIWNGCGREGMRCLLDLSFVGSCY